MTRTAYFAGKVAAVTGAGSGIGRAVALGLAQRGARLALGDLSEAGLADTAEEATRHGAEVHTTVVNVTDRDAVTTWAEDARAHFGVVHHVYNNAGVAGERDLLDPTNYQNIRRIIDVNLWGVIHGTLAFLPHLVASGEGHLVNVSSLNGISASPRQAGYSASKFGVRGFTEGVYADILLDRLPVKASVVYPAGVATNIANAGLRDIVGATPGEAERVKTLNEKLLTMDIGDAARIILDGVQKQRTRVLVGRQAVLADRLVRLRPSSYLNILEPTFRRLFG